MINYQLDKQDFADKYATYEFNLSKTKNDVSSLEQDVIIQIEQDLLKEQNAKGNKRNTFGGFASNGYQEIKSRVKAPAGKDSKNVEMTNVPHTLDVFGSMA